MYKNITKLVSNKQKKSLIKVLINVVSGKGRGPHTVNQENYPCYLEAQNYSFC